VVSISWVPDIPCRSVSPSTHRGWGMGLILGTEGSTEISYPEQEGSGSDADGDVYEEKHGVTR